MTTPDQARAGLITELLSSGALDERWRRSFEEIPRHAFLPDTVWQIDRAGGGRLVPLRRADQPEAWLRLAYADQAVDTQVDDGSPAPDGGWEVTSSASQPTVVAGMLTALDVEPGMRVLEIGTGTGWNAALLAHRVGAENVVTVEVDPVTADRARNALHSAGYSKVIVVTGDGAVGWPEGAPFDRVIATVAANTVPYQWVAQAVPEGRVVVPLANTYQAPGVVTLDVGADGTASGYLGAPAVFMGLRAQRVPRPRVDFVGSCEVETTTDLHPYRWAGDRNAAMAIGQRLDDGVHTLYEETGVAAGTQWLLDPDTRSWASVDLDESAEPPYPVCQAGPRRLLDEVADVYQWWLDSGEPVAGEWRVTVTPYGQRIELDAPKRLDEATRRVATRP